MLNEPRVEIEYLVDYELTFTNSADFNELSDTSEVNTNISNLVGKKGFHLSGGSVDSDTSEVSGVLLDGTYTFYKDSQKAYKGIMGNELSGEDYTFQNQYIDIDTSNENTYIKSIILYFDPTISVNSEIGEFATKISFSNGINADGTQNPLYDGSKTIDNDKVIFMYSFGENSTLKSVRLNILKWNKKNALMKILKITTGYTGIYDRKNLLNFTGSISKTSDVDQLRFGVYSGNYTINVIDNDLIIDSLYKNNLIFKNIRGQFKVDGISQSVFYINSKSSEKGSNEWFFDCIDKIELLKDITKPSMTLESRTLNDVIDFVLSGSGISEIIWDKKVLERCKNITIKNAWFNENQSMYDLLLKCCQVGLVSIYMDRNEAIRIADGLNNEHI